MTVAAWIYLAETLSNQAAALILGAVWFGIGCILLGLSKAARPPAAVKAGITPDPVAPPTAPPPPPSGFGLAQAFLFGLEAGRGTAKRK